MQNFVLVFQISNSCFKLSSHDKTILQGIAEKIFVKFKT